jgi:hypothetical protein
MLWRKIGRGFREAEKHAIFLGIQLVKVSKAKTIAEVSVVAWRWENILGDKLRSLDIPI